MWHQTIGIVGSEEAKFTELTEKLARAQINKLIKDCSPRIIISGGCHLGGIDTWAIEEAKRAHISFRIFLPAIQAWSGGYRERNLQIAKESDAVFCITVKEYPPIYSGDMKFLGKDDKPYCYHCRTNEHVKSGGCWTVRAAVLMGKHGEVIVI